MPGPCLCGDIHCPSCGNPHQAALEEALEKMDEEVFNLVESTDEVEIFKRAGKEAVLAARDAVSNAVQDQLMGYDMLVDSIKSDLQIAYSEIDDVDHLKDAIQQAVSKTPCSPGRGHWGELRVLIVVHNDNDTEKKEYLNPSSTLEEAKGRARERGYEVLDRLCESVPCNLDRGKIERIHLVAVKGPGYTK